MDTPAAPAVGPELGAAGRALAGHPGGAVIERAGVVVWASPAAARVGAPWTPPDGATGGEAVVLDGAPHRIWFLTPARDSASLFRTLFDVNAAVMLLIDPDDGHLVDANSAAERFYGWTLAELRTRTIFDINTLSPTEIQLELERARTARRTHFEFRHRTARGAIADVEIYTGPIAVGGRTLLLSIIHDVTERRRVEEHLRRGQRLEALGRLAAGVAHDFNNLLTVIQTSSQLAQRRVGEDAAGLLAEIQSAARRGADLTRRLLALGSQQTLSPTVVTVAELIDDAVVLLRRTLPDTIALVTEVAPGLPPVHVDRGQIDLVLLNLALNGRDAMPRGGTLTIAGAAATDEPALLPAARYLAVRVSDTGVGMDAATRARIFEPFFTTKAAGAGTGLGLPVAFGVVTQSGGTITVDSQPGDGSTFTLYLPVATGA
ncbi:MAG: PAS domain S-box protein [Myxococcales bacterium]|nr:PAS domain S-box protein [Myxococcales bacterium]